MFCARAFFPRAFLFMAASMPEARFTPEARCRCCCHSAASAAAVVAAASAAAVVAAAVADATAWRQGCNFFPVPLRLRLK